MAMDKGTRALYDAAMSAPNQATCARVLSVAQKGFRDVTRSRFGTFVSRDESGAAEAWTRVRPYRVAYALGTAEQRVAVLAAWKAGEDCPDITT